MFTFTASTVTPKIQCHGGETAVFHSNLQNATACPVGSAGDQGQSQARALAGLPRSARPFRTWVGPIMQLAEVDVEGGASA